MHLLFRSDARVVIPHLWCQMLLKRSVHRDLHPIQRNRRGMCLLDIRGSEAAALEILDCAKMTLTMMGRKKR